MPTSDIPTSAATITDLEQRLKGLHAELCAFLIRDGSGALRKNWPTTRLAMQFAEALANARGDEFARHLQVPHLPHAEQHRRLEVCFRRNRGLRIAYAPAAIVEYWPDGCLDEIRDRDFLRKAWLKFEDVVSFEQTRAVDVMAAELLDPEPDTIYWPRLRLGERYGGFCWEILNSKLIPTVLNAQPAATRHRLAGKLRHWLVRIDPYKFQIVGPSIEFPTTPVKCRKPGRSPHA